MSLTNLNALRAAQLQTDPFDFLVVPGFIGPEALSRINAAYPAIDSAANHALENLSYGEAFASLMDEVAEPAFVEALGEKFDMDLTGMPTTITVRKFCERTDGNIHTDHKSKVITVLLYFNEDWPHEDGQLRMLRSPSDIEDYAAQVPPLGGTMLAFRRTGHSWHGHTRFVGERRMVQINFLDQSPIAVAAQRISRFGTHFMKNVLGMR
ncbi:2OG-Fe(II) oxygenase [Mangrovimicrobium sediminis]|uniref:2OG-Fe(II) oxygenase n=1 Tax=Mangrovimicrobium sediminis TaxID=2562682 RepID=A0A4Z0LW25_9GAMM|nr:2OG-Fe(II) oxygenase [Haliea sp. SAOS-164]TGD71593.1 2OG-Fe(II) oxygenase [Haliea sp. SAOS-164]